MQPTVSLKVKFECVNRSKEVCITRLRLGHCPLNKYLFNIKRHSTGLCDVCGVEETVEHHLLFCNQYSIRDTVLILCRKEGIPFDIASILNSSGVLDIIYQHISRDL